VRIGNLGRRLWRSVVLQPAALYPEPAVLTTDYSYAVNQGITDLRALTLQVNQCRAAFIL
jgi:hypothetical protein